MSQNKIIEKVARAIYEADRTIHPDLPPWEDAQNWYLPLCNVLVTDAARLEARAAIKAITEARDE